MKTSTILITLLFSTALFANVNAMEETTAPSCPQEETALCEALHPEKMSGLLRLDEAPYANPTSLLDVTYNRMIVQSENNAKVLVGIKYETYFVEHNFIAVNTDHCEVTLEKHNQTWSPVHAYCYNMNREFKN